MNSEVYLLSDQIEKVKTKLTDNEYKSMLDSLKKIHDGYKESYQQITDEDESENEDENDYYTIPKMYTDAWYRLSLEDQIKYSGNKHYDEWIWDHLTDKDIQWYKSHLDEVPEHLKEHPSIYPEENYCMNCMIQ